MANREHMALFQRGASAWNTWREEHPDVPMDLSNEDLSEMMISEEVFMGCWIDLSRTDLRGAKLSRRLSSADLRGANLSGMSLNGALLDSADLRGANLSNTDLSRADLDYAKLSGADLRGANLSEADQIHACDLREANLGGADLSVTYLFRVDLSDANLSGANLSKARMERVTLRGANLEDANLSGCVLQTVDLCDANLRGVSLGSCTLAAVDLRGAYISWVQIYEASLRPGFDPRQIIYDRASLFNAQERSCPLTVKATGVEKPDQEGGRAPQEPLEKWSSISRWRQERATMEGRSFWEPE